MKEFDFKITPKPRELTEEEVNKFKLRYSSGEKIKPWFENTDVNWSVADDGKLLIYRIYNVYTNYIIILRYTPDKDVWEKVKIEDIKNFNGFVWKIGYYLA